MQVEKLAEVLASPKLPIHIEQVEKELLVILAAAPPDLGRPAARMIQSGGKRLRPALTIASAAISGGKVNQKVISAAAAVELVHLASLVHDDIIDGHKLRRGKPTIVAREGLNSALLVGDYLLATGCARAGAVNAESGRVLALAVAAMCQGQALELNANYTVDPKNNIYIETARQKAGALIAAACQIGGHCAGLPSNDIAALGRYGEAFGLAFQIIDDIMDGDMNRALANEALAEAKRHSALAADALKSFGSNPRAAGLAKLPGIYLSGLEPKLL